MKPPAGSPSRKPASRNRSRRAGLRTGQRDRGASEHALGSDHDRLLVAAGGQGEVCREPGGAGDDLKGAAAGASFEVAVDATAGFAPGPGEGPSLGEHIAGKIEFVAVAGAGEALMEAVAAGAHRIGCAAPNSFGRAVVESDGPAAGPIAGQAGERPRLRVAGRRRDHKKRDDRE